MNLDLKDRIFVVTGGAGSLGTEMVKALVNYEAQCVVPIRNMTELESFPLKDHEKVELIRGIDLADKDQARHFYEEVMEKAGYPWAAINLAGGFGMGRIEQTGLDDFMHQMRLNTYTCFNSCKEAVNAMRKSGNGGRIVNITSRPGIEPLKGKGLSAYASSKAAVAALTQSLSSELTEDQILVNAIAPSIIDTEPNRNAMPEADFDQWVKPEDIVHQILFLISPGNQSTTGAIVPVYGRS